MRRYPSLVAALWLAAPSLALGAVPPGAQGPAAGAPAGPTTRSDRVVAGALLDQVAESAAGLVVGEWVTYRVSGGPGREAFWRIAVVGTERDAKGREARWVELDFGQHPNMVAPIAQMRALMTPLASRWEMSRLFVGYGAARPFEVDPDQIDLWGGGPQKPPAAKQPKVPAGVREHVRVVRGQPQRIMTQAGSVLADPVEVFYRGTSVRKIWTSAAIPVIGLVKIELPGTGHVLEVRDHGIDAKPMMVLPPPDAPTVTLERPGAPGGTRATPAEEEPTP